MNLDIGSGLLKKYCCLLFLVFCSSVMQGQAFSAVNLDKKCSQSKTLSLEEFQLLLSEVSMLDLQTRSNILSLMRDPKNGCRRALETRLVEISEKPSNFQNNTGRHAALTLGLLLDLPSALTIVETEAASGGGSEWLAMLQQWDEKAHRQLLKKWVLGAAEKFRNDLGLQTLNSEAYGKLAIEERMPGTQKVLLSPLILDLYLKSLEAQVPSAEELFALNIHYASTQAGSRRLFRDSFSLLVRKNTSAWLKTFRLEKTWTQFQIIELMGHVGGSEMVKELLWLSQNHVDLRIKSRASQALDEAVQLH